MSGCSIRRWWHRHIWFAQAVQVERYNTGDQTNVLLRCDCGKLKVDVINGGWRPDQLGLTVKGKSTA